MTKAVVPINADAFRTYDTATFTLIPLNVYHAKRRNKAGKTRSVGKAPRDNRWSTADYNSKATVKECITLNANMGVRLTSAQLVIDVDPRNGGNKGFADLCAELAIDPAAFPTVVTGSGGLHLYMSKPADLLIVDTLPDFKGVEFKSRGRQVVAAGSVHPETLRHYEWDGFLPDIADGLPEAPAKLLRVIARPAREVMVKGGGQWDQDQAAEALADLDPEDFREHGEWLKVMMGIHHATNGDARHEFVEWSTSDSNYADDAELIGRRWDSLHTSRPEGMGVVTHRTILKLIAEKGKGKFQWTDPEERKSELDELAAASEGDEPEEPTPTPTKPTKPKPKSKLPGGDDVSEENSGGFDDESTKRLEELNARYATIVEGGKFRIVYQQFDPQIERKAWERISGHDFMLLYGNERVQRGEEELEKLSRNAANTMPLGKAWLEWKPRKHYEGIIFDPRGVERSDGYLNTWTGFAMGSGSAQGSWKYLRELMFETLAEGNDTNFAYIMNWLRFLFQHPEKRAEVAMVFMGGKGVGKSTLGNTITKCIGHHAIAIQSPALITGRFNSHFRDLLFLFADEAVKPHDRAAESQLKALITEPEIAIEGKGVDVRQARNMLHIMMASNESWVVPASADERRYFVAQCVPKYQYNKTFFDKLNAELQADGNSGYKRFLWDMLKTELPEGFHPREYPLTAALVEQKVRSQSPLAQFFFDAINEEIVPFPTAKGAWQKERVRVFVSQFREAFAQWQRERGINAGSMGRGSMRFVFKELKTLFPSAKVDQRDRVTDEFAGVVQASEDGRAKSIELPSMTECRHFFNESLGGDCFAGTDSDFG